MKERDVCYGKRPDKERQLVESVGDQNPGLEASTGSRSSPDISFAPCFLLLLRDVLEDLGSNHLPILLIVSLCPVFQNSIRPFPSIFRKLVGLTAFYFDFHCPFSEKYSSLSSASALFTFLTLNAAKSSIPFGRIKPQPNAWWSAEVEEAVSERRKAFPSIYRSNDVRQALISSFRHASSVIAKAEA